MFCIDNRCTDIYFNLAAEEYLLKQKRGNFFMLWAVGTFRSDWETSECGGGSGREVSG